MPENILEPPGLNIAMSTLVPSVNMEDGPDLEDNSTHSEEENAFRRYQDTDSREGSTSSTRPSLIHAEDIKDLNQCKLTRVRQCYI